MRAWPALHDKSLEQTNPFINQNEKQKLNKPGEVSVGDLYPHAAVCRLVIWSLRDFLRLPDSLYGIRVMKLNNDSISSHEQ